MKLSECRIGDIVASIFEKNKIGHIIDLLINEKNEIVLVVKWAVKGYDIENNITYITPNNVCKLEDLDKLVSEKERTFEQR